ncbi:hypothetical protein Tco_1375537 [Tanacetum coccineum]
MDSIIPIGQKNTLAKHIILFGADNHLPMLDKDLYDSWKSIMETKKYAELSAIEKIQADCDLKATNIILQSLPSDIYSLVNNHRVAKDLWKKVQLLIQGTSLTKQERECKLYDAFDKFTHIKGESLYQYYLRFTQLINDMNIYKMKMEKFQVNIKFLNSLPPEWSKFVTDVKLVNDFHTTNFDQLHAYLEQYELHANEVRLMRERINQQTHLAEFPQINSGLAVPVFKQGDDPIDAINKMMSFLSTVVTSRFPSTNNQLRNFSNPRQQETIHDGRVIWQDSVQSQRGKGMLHDPRVVEGPVTEMVITHNATYQEDDLDAYDSDCDDFSTAKAVLMDNLSSYGSYVLSEYLLETQNAAIQDTNSPAQQDAMILYVFEQLSNQVTNCNKVNKDNLIANESLSAELERYKERVKLLKERQNVDLRRTFTLVGNACPLTRITATNKVPIREHVPLDVGAQEFVVTKVYTRRLKITAVAPSPSSSVDLSSGLVPNPIPQQHCTPPPRDDWDRLLQPMFEEYFNTPTIAVSPVPVANAPIAVDLADSPVSTSIEQISSIIIPLDFSGSSSNVRPIHTPFESLGRWTKDHPISNVIGDHSRFVSTRKQLQTDAMWCYFDAFLTSLEPKNFK